MRDLPLLAGCCLAVILGACGTGAGRIDTACRSNDDCGADELCATGLCENGLGLCATVPVSCDDSVNFVCGCDGRTYQSSCFAEQARVRLASSEPCLCASNSECVDGQYCALDDSCSNVGSCLPHPESCDPSDTQEVCGCDGSTYSNECSAFQAGVRVSALGACECDTSQNCSSNEYCDAITCDGPGNCAIRPSSCPPPENGAVIGCDGVSYESACSAASAGVRLRP